MQFIKQNQLKLDKNSKFLFQTRMYIEGSTYKTSTMEELLGGAYSLKEFDDGWNSRRQWESQRTIIQVL